MSFKSVYMIFRQLTKLSVENWLKNRERRLKGLYFHNFQTTFKICTQVSYFWFQQSVTWLFWQLQMQNQTVNTYFSPNRLSINSVFLLITMLILSIQLIFCRFFLKLCFLRFSTNNFTNSKSDLAKMQIRY